MDFERALVYIDSLNVARYAGYSNWRLPTLEEAMSLMEPAKVSATEKLFIKSIFDETQVWIWTSDKYSASAAWFVSFYNGYYPVTFESKEMPTLYPTTDAA